MKVAKLVVLGLVFWFAWLSFSFPAWADPIKLGMSAAFTGASRSLGIELYRGSMAYLDLINQTGGVNNRPIALQVYDDGYNPLPAIQNTMKLIEQDRVLLLVNYVGTPTVTRILPLFKKYEDQHLLLLFPFTGAQPHRQPPYNSFVFNLRASYRNETGGLVDHFLEIGRQRIAVFYQIDAYGRSGWDGVQKRLKEKNLTIVAEATYKRGTDFQASLKPQVEILRKANPDAIIAIGSYEACGGFIRDARDAGWDVPIANVSFVGSEKLLNVLKQHHPSRYSTYIKNLINSQVVPSYEDLSLPAVQEYRRLMDRYQTPLPAVFDTKDYQPMPYSFVSFEGFLNAKVLVEMLKRTPNLSESLSEPVQTRIALRKTLESMKNLDVGIGETITFDRLNHQALSKIYYTTVEDDRFVPIQDQDWQQWAKPS